MRPLVCFLILIFKTAVALADAPAPGVSAEFIQNKGQWTSAVLFSAQLPQGWMFLEKSGFTYNFLENNYFDVETEAVGGEKKLYKGHSFKVHFENADPQTNVIGQGKLNGIRNYFLGSDPASWATGVPAFSEIKYTQVYKNIGLRLYTSGQRLKYDFLLAPRTNVLNIKMKYEGVKQLAIRNGRLYITTSLNQIIEEKPFAYQLVAGERREVACEFTLTKYTVGFNVTGPYDPDLPLVIDPELIFMTYAGANAGLSANCATADAAGNTLIASRTMGPQYPVTPGAYQTIRQGNNTGISKFNDKGTALIYATYLGGSSLTNHDEYPLALIVNKQNELIILGHTNASDFPVTANAYDRTYNEGRDYFISKISANGTDLIASTFLGGSGQESGGIGNTPAQIALDAMDNILVAGCTQSEDFRIVNGFQTVNAGGYDGVVAKLNSGLTNLLWSSFIGGKAEDLIYDIKVGANGRVYLGGSTLSSDFPTTQNTLNPSLLGNRDGYIAIISANGNQLENATFLGTSQADLVKYVQVDKEENFYASGFTTGSYPIFPTNTYGTPNSTGGYFIHKLNFSLRTTLFSTHLGSNSGLTKVPTAFRVNSCGNIFLAAYALTTAPLSADAQEKNRKTMYVCQLSKDAKQLVYGSYLGGTDVQPHVHLANTSLITEAGILHQIECTYATNQPITPGAYDPTYYDRPDGAVAKFQFSPFILNEINAKATSPPPSCAPYRVQFSNTTENGITYTWDFGDGSSPSSQVNPIHIYQKPGQYRARLIAANPASCKMLDTAFVNITVVAPPLSVLPRQTRYLCNQSVVLDAGNPGYNYLWSTGATTQTITVAEPGTYQVELSLGACKSTDSVVVAFALPDLEVPNVFTPNQDGKNDFFVIRNSGPNTKLQVYNRWGNLVYTNDNYLNNWDGRNLSQGTYYYLIQSVSNCSTKKGWLEIIY